MEIAGILGLIVLAFLFLPNPWNSFVTVVVALLGAIYIWNRMKIGKCGQKTEPEELLEEIALEEELVSTDRLLWEREHLKEERKEKQVEYDNLQEQLSEQDELGDEYRKLDRRREALLFAVKRLEDTSADMQKQLTMLLNQKASAIIAEITGGRYERLAADENLRIGLLGQGKRTAIEQVSQGTLEQVYFALRMAVAELLYDEEYPVIGRYLCLL